MTGPHPFDFAQARYASEEAGNVQRRAEQWLIDASRAYAQAEEAYRVALAKTIVEVHDGGAAWTVAPDLARGHETVARLRRERDIAEGIKEAAVQAAWRAAADRRDTASFIAWSQRAQFREEPTDDFGARRAA